MVGNIGALRTPPVAPVDRAVEYALALISGWAKKERKPFEAALEDLRESAAHNAEVYEQASAALKELSAREKEVRLLAGQAQAAHDAAMALVRRTETDTADALAALSIKQATHQDQVDSFHRSADARDTSLVERETEVTAREAKLTVDENALGNSSHRIAALADNAEVKLSKANTAMADMRAVLLRHG